MKKYIALILFLVLTTSISFADIADPYNHTTWKVTASSYESSMTITSILTFNGIESTDVNDKIAAFVGDDCRGTQQPIIIINGRYLAYLMVHGNIQEDERVTLYMYDSSEDKYTKVSEKLTFTPEATYGTVNNPYLSLTTYNISFKVKVNEIPLEGASIHLDENDEVISGNNGIALFENVIPKNHMAYYAAYEGLDTIRGMLSLIGETKNEITVNLEMNPARFDVNFSVINGHIPVENAKISLTGYGIETTNVYGDAVFKNVVISNDIKYTVTGLNYDNYSGSISLIESNITEKVSITPSTHTVVLNILAGTEPVEGVSVKIDLPEEILTEDFYNERLPEYFSTDLINEWNIDSEKTFQGDYSIKSANIVENQKSEIAFTKTTRAGNFSFFYNVSSEEKYDCLYFYIDGKEKGKWSGITGWKSANFEITEGEHFFKWVYQKDGSRTMGNDCAWVDYIIYPPETMISMTQESDHNGLVVFKGVYAHEDINYYIDDKRYNPLVDSISVIDSDFEKDVNLTTSIIFNISKEYYYPFYETDSIELEGYGKKRIGNGVVTFDKVTPVDSIKYTTGTFLLHYKSEGYVDARTMTEKTLLISYRRSDITIVVEGEDYEDEDEYFDDEDVFTGDDNSGNIGDDFDFSDYFDQINGNFSMKNMTVNIENLEIQNFSSEEDDANWSGNVNTLTDEIFIYNEGADTKNYLESDISNNGKADFKRIAQGMIKYTISHRGVIVKTDSVKITNEKAVITVNVVPRYNLKFNIASSTSTGSLEIDNAKIEINKSNNSLYSDFYGNVNFKGIAPQGISYKITAEGYKDISGKTFVLDADKEVKIAMDLIPDIQVSNFISPNGDGINDFWEIKNIERYDAFNVEIMSPTGESIYKTSNYSQNLWNGKRNGNTLPNGIYYYIISTKNQEIIFKGIINLLN
ncbi:MAG: gliding motility-associated C-terminal domain-containing protein [Ichthyobacteriaceae bacterium]|nr:gliding motility-associated C-terminal domain-containing protein [Ichthyobacteriaceae bacterium]